MKLRTRRVPASIGTARTGKVRLILLIDEPGAARDVLRMYAGRGSRFAPHYYVAADGTATKLLAERRVAPVRGSAVWDQTLQEVDDLAVVVVLEHTPGTPFPRALLKSANVLLDRLQTRYRLPESAIVRWVSSPELPDQGVLLPAELPPEFPIRPDIDVLLEDLSDVIAVLSPKDPPTPQQLWSGLVQEVFAKRGEGLKPTWAFHQQALALNLGAPLARSAGEPKYVDVGGVKYGFQVFARDTLLNEIPKWGEVQRLSSLLNGAIPADGLARKVLEASYAAVGTQLFANQAFAQMAVREQLGVALGAGYRATVAGQLCVIQVFALDTLYTPLANPESATKWGDVRRLSQTEDDALAQALWAETYKICGAAYDPASKFQQRAELERLGTPLSGVSRVTVEGGEYELQVFAGGALYAVPGGEVQALHSLSGDVKAAIPAPEPEPVATTPAAPPTPVTPTIVSPVAEVKPMLAGSGVVSVWLDQHPQTPAPIRSLILNALSLLGYENTIYEALPANLQKLAYGFVNPDPNSLNYRDICCADFVTLALATAGLPFRWRGPGGTTNTRIAHYFTPCAENTLARAVADNEPMMPGDMWTYSYDGGPVADHVNLYVGGMGGTLAANGRACNPQQHVLAEGCINFNGIKPDIYKYNLPTGTQWYFNSSKWRRRIRLLEIERMYREVGML